MPAHVYLRDVVRLGERTKSKEIAPSGQPIFSNYHLDLKLARSKRNAEHSRNHFAAAACHQVIQMNSIDIQIEKNQTMDDIKAPDLPLPLKGILVLDLGHVTSTRARWRRLLELSNRYSD
jgi:hypothetical protein